ncbi:hypothetical protein HPB50_016540 [Hyalomma asiaticum]|uniref:Uncharacterized protein n=1 Tax=Hyalomma asiaticum TaxID=266040 RepID=A0ACB7SZ07_HYAAI|nr:hypothetical protein HPB50_016540 [Hyalomma asiaticum]
MLAFSFLLEQTVVFLDKAMLKLLLNHWQESYHKAPTRVTSEDPLLCTDLAKTRPNEEFLVSRVNPLFVDSSSEVSPSSTINKPSTSTKTTAEVHSSQDGDNEVASTSKQPPKPPDPLGGAAELPQVSAVAETNYISEASLKTDATDAEAVATADSDKKTSESQPSEGDSPKDSLETDRSSSPKPLVELREWQENKAEDRVLNRLRSSGRASLITKEKLNLVEKVIAERLGKRVPEPGIRKTIELLKNESAPPSPQQTLLPAAKREQAEEVLEQPSTSELPTDLPSTSSGDKQESPVPSVTPPQPASTEETASVVDGSVQAEASKTPEAPSEAGSSVASASAPKDESSETVSMPKIEDAHSDSMTDSSNSKKEERKNGKSSGPSTSEDSGITRGDQVYSDSGRRKISTKSDSSEQSSSEASRGKRHRRIKKDSSRDSTRKRHKSSYKSRCSFCNKAAKKSHQRSGHKHKHRSMAESGLVSGSGSLSDLAFEHPWLSDSCTAHCRQKRSSITCMESCRDYPCEDFHNAVYRYPGGHVGCEGCSCIRAPFPECCRWGDVPRSRYSWNGSEAAAVAAAGGHPLCACRRAHPMFSSRRKVKFAHKSKDSLQQKAELNEDEEDADRVAGEGNNDAATKSDQGSYGEVPPKESPSNGHILAENGLLEKQQGPPGSTYAWEEWRRYMREKNLRSRRKRALCMGVIALSIILFVGISVSLGLAYLRRKF